MRKLRWILILIFGVLLLQTCSIAYLSHLFFSMLPEKAPADSTLHQEAESLDTENDVAPEAQDQGTASDTESARSYIDPSGMTLATRILTPAGYTREAADENSLTAFLRNYPLKEHGSPVRLYNGQLSEDQDVHAAVFALPLEPEDLQQCADSVMRVYAEYYLSIGQEEKIAFHYTTGFLAEYAKWRDGYRIKVDGEDFRWILSAEYDDSYENFRKYMRMVFIYANTLSMDTYEAVPIDMDDLQVGDVFLEGGSPGHTIMIVDICSDATGRKAFLLAQGHMPAQEFELMKNPAHEGDPWYYEDEIVFPFETDAHTFQEGSLKRLCYFP